MAESKTGNQATEGTIILDSAVAGVGAPGATDDLSLSLHAISGRLDMVKLTDGKLAPSPSASGAPATPSFTAEEIIEYARHGCTRLMEIVHNHNMNKVEAMDRGALLGLKGALERHEDIGVRIAAVRALRSICFKNNEAKDKLKEGDVVSTIVAVMRDAANLVATAPEAQRKESLALLDETVNTLTAVINNHDVNVASANSAGASAVTAEGIAAVSKVASAGAADVSNVQKKLTLLQMLLQ